MVDIALRKDHLRFPPKLEVLGDTVAGPPEGESNGDGKDGQAEAVHTRGFTKSELLLLLTLHRETFGNQSECHQKIKSIFLALSNEELTPHTRYVSSVFTFLGHTKKMKLSMTISMIIT